jgi:hypothetical protein
MAAIMTTLESMVVNTINIFAHSTMESVNPDVARSETHTAMKNVDIQAKLQYSSEKNYGFEYTLLS